MLSSRLLTLVPFFLAAVEAGTIVWDGRFNDYTTATDLDNWSWSNQVGEYQWYIHGTGATTDYVNLDSTYKNPADTGSNQGAKITIDSTAVWNSDSMWRTELIPQTSENLGTGTLWYHFSVKKSATNSPNSDYEHQVCFFESHFTELKYGSGAGDQLAWYVGGTSQKTFDWAEDTWHNFAYEIDFDASTVALWHSTGSDDLTLVGDAVSASTSTNSADWHLGVLRLAATSGTTDTAAEDWYFSGVYVESGSLTTQIGSGSSGSTDGESSSTAAAAATTKASSTAAAAATTSSTSTTAAAAVATSETSTTAATAVTTSSTSTTAAAAVTTSSTSTTAAAAATTSSTSTAIAAPATTSSSTIAAPVTTSSTSSTIAAPATTAAATTSAGHKTTTTLTTRTTFMTVTTTAGSSASSSSAAAGTQAKYEQCGGKNWTGGSCASGLTCTYQNDYYSQCL